MNCMYRYALKLDTYELQNSLLLLHNKDLEKLRPFGWFGYHKFSNSFSTSKPHTIQSTASCLPNISPPYAEILKSSCIWCHSSFLYRTWRTCMCLILSPVPFPALKHLGDPNTFSHVVETHWVSNIPTEINLNWRTVTKTEDICIIRALLYHYIQSPVFWKEHFLMLMTQQTTGSWLTFWGFIK